MRRLALMLALVLACGDGGALAPVQVTGEGGEVCLQWDPGSDAFRSSCVSLYDDRKVDLLFVIDAGPHALGVQARVADAVEGFVAGLDAVDAELELRIAITAADDGNPACASTVLPAGTPVLTSCREHPDAFVGSDGVDRFEEICATRCPLAALDTLPSSVGDEDPAAHPWLERIASDTNLVGDVALDDALRCGLLLGNLGCRFDAPLGAARSALARSEDALDPSHGFFRPEAFAAIVIVGAGVECSLGPAGAEAFDPDGTRALWPDPDATAPSEALCWNAGMACEPSDDGDAMSCTPVDLDAGGEPSGGASVLLPIATALDPLLEYVTQQKEIFPDRRMAIFAIGGTTDAAQPGSYPVAEPDSDDAVGTVCDVLGEAVLPAARIEAIAALEPADIDVEVSSACADDYRDALDDVLAAIDDQLIPNCLPACVADIDDDREGLQIDCGVTAEQPTPEGSSELPLPRCIDGVVVPDDAPGCWTPRIAEQLSDDCRRDGWNLEIEIHWRGAEPRGLSLSPSCKLSQDKATDCPLLP